VQGQGRADTRNDAGAEISVGFSACPEIQGQPRMGQVVEVEEASY
jgi:hypothetical protein